MVVEGGAWQRYYSHWGAGRVVHDLIPGPVAATRSFRSHRETQEWLDDIWCEGAALVDHDHRTLLWFTDADTWADHLAALAVLAATWPGWDIRFAYDGVADLTHHLGLGRDLTRPPGQPETSGPSWYADPEETQPRTVLSLRLPDGSVRAWNGACAPVEHLTGGSGLVDLLAASPPTPAPTEMPYGGLHVDPQTRTVSLWTVETVTGLHSWPLPGWEDWALDFQGHDHTGQAELLPADFPLPQPPLTAALLRLSSRLQPPDGTALLHRATAEPGPEGSTAVVNPAALVPHDPTDPTPAELAALRTAFDALLAGAETG
ncbi:hypothetical protein ASE03_28715 [Kitasatospora sp. Root187]|nr:hypothetical protein ASC99_35665 [Kitasatospora sp. Root107]KRB68885.1 hypothetical protein ASE03_28715 [Kitasatospora sp. Root187]